MEKYTAKQYAEMAGGHTVSEEKKSLNLGFIGSELTESKMFRSKGRVEGTSNRDMADLTFMNLIALYILYNEYDFAPAAKGYAKKTMQSGNFNNFRIGQHSNFYNIKINLLHFLKLILKKCHLLIAKGCPRSL